MRRLGIAVDMFEYLITLNLVKYRLVGYMNKQLRTINDDLRNKAKKVFKWPHGNA